METELSVKSVRRMMREERVECEEDGEKEV